MPWCDPCRKFFNPTAVDVEGHCPDCGGELDPDDEGVDPSTADADLETMERTKVPWHFWVAVVAMTVYLGWRLVQGIIWLVH